MYNLTQDLTFQFFSSFETFRFEVTQNFSAVCMHCHAFATVSKNVHKRSMSDKAQNKWYLHIASNFTVTFLAPQLVLLTQKYSAHYEMQSHHRSVHILGKDS